MDSNSLNSRLDQPQVSQLQKAKKKSSIWWMWILGLLLIAAIFPSKKSHTTSTPTTVPTNTVSTTQAPKTNYTIEKGTEYSYMSDQWNVYIAKAVSDSMLKIEHWDKSLSSTKKLSYSEDIGVFKINDPENGFIWADKEHTAFSFIFSDKNNKPEIFMQAKAIAMACMNISG